MAPAQVGFGRIRAPVGQDVAEGFGRWPTGRRTEMADAGAARVVAGLSHGPHASLTLEPTTAPSDELSRAIATDRAGWKPPCES